MITYYKRNGVVVTSDELVVNNRRYQLRELDNLEFRSGYFSLPTAGCAMTAAMFIAVAGWGSSLTGSSTASVLGIVIAVFFLIATLISHRVNPPAHELSATYHNETVRLLWSRDVHECNRIRVALWHARQARPVT